MCFEKASLPLLSLAFISITELQVMVPQQYSASCTYRCPFGVLPFLESICQHVKPPHTLQNYTDMLENMKQVEQRRCGNFA